MSPLRALGIVGLLVAGFAVSAILLAHSLQDLRASTTSAHARHGHIGAGADDRGARRHSRRGQSTDRARRHGSPAKTTTRTVAATGLSRTATAVPAGHHAGVPLGIALPGGSPLLLVGVEIVGGFVLVAVTFGLLCARRLRRHRDRDYELYEVHLSAHDEAKPQDLEDMVEQISNIVRVFPARRARDGQPFVAVELICGARDSGEMQWSLNLRCEPGAVAALDAAISSAYPDVRVGHRHQDAPTPRPGRLREPGSVMRFRKERSFVYPLMASSELLASPPLEQIARAQIGLGQPSIVRFALTPTPTFFEEYARRRFKRHENKLVRQERWGLPEGGLLSTLNRAEMTDAQRTQNRSLFWLETQVAADTVEACKTIAAAVQSRRGENRLHRRWLGPRAGLYRRRFAQARGPLVPSTRSLVSAAEVAHLLALPTARMKGVPVRRQMLPRIPAPADCERAIRPVDNEPAAAPVAAPGPRRSRRVIEVMTVR